jgi:hypothetical protein
MLRAAVSHVPPHTDRGSSPVLVERAAQREEMLDRARARGESAPTVTDLLEIVVAPLYFRALFCTSPNGEDVRRLVDGLFILNGQSLEDGQ